jgi:hypothetical protein
MRWTRAADASTQFIYLGAFCQLERWLLAGVVVPVLLDPIAEGRLPDPALTGDLGGRPLALDDQLRRLVAKLRTELPILPRH